MSNVFIPEEKRFYKKTSIDTNVTLRPIYGDLYGVTDAKVDLTNATDAQFLMASTTVPVPPYYGGGKLEGCTIEYYVNSISGTHSATIPRLKVYRAKDNLTLVSGSFPPLFDNKVSGTTASQTICAYSSFLDYETPWLSEQFDGENKGMGDRASYTKEYWNAYNAGVYSIKGEDYLEFLDNKGFFGWRQRLSGRSKTFWEDATSGVIFNLMQNPRYGENKWAISNDALRFKVTTDTEKYVSDTLANWQAYGAYQNSDSVSYAPSRYTQYDSDFVGRVTQFNSIFNYVSEAPDIEDVKVQSVGTTGDDAKMYTESGFVINTSDKLTGAASGEMRNFYENLSGTTADIAPSYAKIFGCTPAAAASGGSAYPQTVMGSLDYLPIPYPMEIGASGNIVDGVGEDGTGPATAQEIELKLKFKSMTPVLKADTGNLHFHRGFFVVFCETPPRTEETFHQYIRRIDSVKGDTLKATGLWVFNEVGDSDISPELVAVPFLDKNSTTVPISFNAADTHMPISAFSSKSGYNSFMTIPLNSWLTLRFKMDSRAQKILVYTPNSFDEKGAMRHIVLDTADWPNTDGNTIGLNSMSIWLNNFRAINTTEAANVGVSGLNPGMIADNEGFQDEDMSNAVLIDSINFNNYNNSYRNATVTPSNPVPIPLKIPSAPVCIPTFSGSSTSTTVTPTISGTASSADNYYGSESTLTHSTLSFGFESGMEMNVNDQIGLFMNNFSTDNETLVNSIDGGTTSGAANALMLKGSYTASGGGSGFRALRYDVQVGKPSRRPTLGGAQAFINTDNTGSGSIGGFTQKGFIWLSGSAFDANDPATGGGYWQKRENPYVFARVLAANGDGTDIVVDKPEIFDLPTGPAEEGGTDYIMWRPDVGHSNTLDFQNPADWWAGSGNVGANFAFPSLHQRAQRKGNIIYLNRPTNVDDEAGQATARGGDPIVTMASYFPEGVNKDADSFRSKSRLGSIFISPKKYWVNIHICNASGNKWGEWYRPREGDGAQEGFFNYKSERLRQRYYGGVIPVSSTANTDQGAEVGTYGTTTNESLFSDGVSINKWDTNITPDSIFDVETDYGFGVYEDATEDKPSVTYGGFLNSSVPSATSYNYVDVGGFVEKQNPRDRSVFNFAFIPFLEDFDANRPYTINVDSKNGSKPPQVLWAYETVLPEIDNLTVKPNTKEIKQENVDELTQPEKTDLQFTWAEQCDNVWYRLLWVDNDLIQSKYHKANFIAPFNEIPNVDTNYYYYSSSAEYADKRNPVSWGVAPATYSTIEGFQGWGFSGSTAISGTSLTLGSASEYTMMCHLRPSVTGTIINAYDSSDSSKFTLRLNSGKKLVATMNASDTTLTSTTTYDVDGVQPLAVVITYNKSLDNNNFKMYVNNSLEDTADYTTDFVNTALTLRLAQDYTGLLEEISWHTKEVYVAQNTNNFTLPTKNLPDLTGSKSNKYQSRLFLMDYHNIRGTSPREVAMSNTAAWKVTGV